MQVVLRVRIEEAQVRNRASRPGQYISLSYSVRGQPHFGPLFDAFSLAPEAGWRLRDLAVAAGIEVQWLEAADANELADALVGRGLWVSARVEYVDQGTRWVFTRYSRRIRK